MRAFLALLSIVLCQGATSQPASRPADDGSREETLWKRYAPEVRARLWERNERIDPVPPEVFTAITEARKNLAAKVKTTQAEIRKMPTKTPADGAALREKRDELSRLTDTMRDDTAVPPAECFPEFKSLAVWTIGTVGRIGHITSVDAANSALAKRATSFLRTVHGGQQVRRQYSLMAEDVRKIVGTTAMPRTLSTPVLFEIVGVQNEKQVADGARPIPRVEPIDLGPTVGITDQALRDLLRDRGITVADFLERCDHEKDRDRLGWAQTVAASLCR